MGKKILVVDDEPDVVKYLCSFLEDNGFTTFKAGDGKEGMELAVKELPDLISLDITMPKETGTRMLRNLKVNPATSSIPVIIVTGVDPLYEDFITNRKQVNPPVAFFEKPIDKDKYLEEIRKILGQ
ncbi:MAG: response regulator [Chitinispirillia bacterium]|jgi:CheY-like chemotaxis protein